MPSYNEQFIRERVGSGKDANRARTADQLFQQATQPPHEDDAAALAQLKALSGVSDPNEGWATMDAKNYGRMLLNRVGGQYDYGEAHDGGGFFGSIKSVGGDLLKYGAPIGAAFIPGIGPLAAGAIGAAGNTAGRALKGDPFSLQSLVLSGAAGAGGNALLGGQGVKGISQIGQHAGGAAGAAGNATQAGAGAASAAAPAAAAGPGGLLGTIGKYGPVAVGALGAYQTMQDQSKANHLRDAAVQSAQQDYAGREPFRLKALSMLDQQPTQRPNLASVFDDPGNPYNRVRY